MHYPVDEGPSDSDQEPPRRTIKLEHSRIEFGGGYICLCSFTQEHIRAHISHAPGS